MKGNLIMREHTIPWFQDCFSGEKIYYYALVGSLEANVNPSKLGIVFVEHCTFYISPRALDLIFCIVYIILVHVLDYYCCVYLHWLDVGIVECSLLFIVYCMY